MSESKTRKEYALDAIEHIVYETRMFLFCIIELHNNITKYGINNALLESFAIHFRNLYIFFNSRETIKPDRPNEEDENVYYADIKGSSYPFNEKIYKEYNDSCKKIVHIDRNRTKLKTNNWDMNKLYSVFKPAILSFINDHDIKPLIKEKSLHEINEFLNTIDNLNSFNLPFVTDTDN